VCTVLTTEVFLLSVSIGLSLCTLVCKSATVLKLKSGVNNGSQEERLAALVVCWVEHLHLWKEACFLI